MSRVTTDSRPRTVATPPPAAPSVLTQPGTVNTVPFQSQTSNVEPVPPVLRALGLPAQPDTRRTPPDIRAPVQNPGSVNERSQYTDFSPGKTAFSTWTLDMTAGTATGVKELPVAGQCVMFESMNFDSLHGVKGITAPAIYEIKFDDSQEGILFETHAAFTTFFDGAAAQTAYGGKARLVLNNFPFKKIKIVAISTGAGGQYLRVTTFENPVDIQS